MTTVEQKIMQDRNRARAMVRHGYGLDAYNSEENISDALADLMHLLQAVLIDDPDYPDPRIGVLAQVETAVAHYLTESFAGAVDPYESAVGLGGYTNPAVFIETTMEPTTEARR